MWRDLAIETNRVPTTIPASGLARVVPSRILGADVPPMLLLTDYKSCMRGLLT